MPNGNKNNNDEKEIELLPPELRRPEEKKRKLEKEEVKFFIPSTEEKPKGPTFGGKFFGAHAPERTPVLRETEIEKDKSSEREMEIFKMQKDVKQPRAAVIPPAPRPMPEAPRKPEFLPKPEIPPKPPVPQKEPVIRPAIKIEPRPAQKPSKLEAPAPKGRRFGITLIPEEKDSVEGAKKPKRVIILAVIIFIMAAIFAGLYFYLRWSIDSMAVEIKRVETDLAATSQRVKDAEEEKNQVQVFQKQLKITNKLLGNHVYWTNFFNFLEKNIVTDVYFSNLIGGSDEQIILTGIAKSYKAVSRQIISFRAAEEIESVSVSSASASIDSEGKVVEVNFDARLKLKPEMFFK
jgi:Tfp pilus assembly protein PilN